ncbi:MAG: mechanosensitive ion channel family protein [Vicinamibacteria bacterium]
METASKLVLTRGLEFLLQVLAAVALYFLGRWLIRGVRVLVRRALELRQLDPTLAKYIDQTLGIVLTILVVVAALGVLGVQTNTLAGLLAAAGVAVGVAWSGLLSNIAAGLFMVSLRPFKKGDTVQIGGALGDVELIGFFGTALLAPDGTRVIVGNAKALGDNIHNLSGGPHRRIDARAQLPWACDPRALYEAIRLRLAEEPKVLASPSPVVETFENNAAGPLAVIRPCCVPSHYGEVFFLTNRIVAEEIAKAGLTAPSALLR